MVHYHGPRSKGTNQGKSSVGRARPKMGVRGQLQVSSRTARPTSIVAMVYRAAAGPVGSHAASVLNGRPHA